MEGPPLSERQSPPSLPLRELPRPSPASDAEAQGSAPPGGWRPGNSPFRRSGKIRAIAIKCDSSCIAENRTAAIGCPFFGVGDCMQQSAFALACLRPLFIARCQLSAQPQKKFPGTGPHTHRIFRCGVQNRGACAGEKFSEEGGLEGGRPLSRGALPPRSFPPPMPIPLSRAIPETGAPRRRFAWRR